MTGADALVAALVVHCDAEKEEAAAILDEALQAVADRLAQDETLAAATAVALDVEDVVDAGRDLAGAVIQVIVHRDLPSAVGLLSVLLRLPALAEEVGESLGDLVVRLVDVVVPDPPQERADRLRRKARAAAGRGESSKAQRLRARAKRLEERHGLPAPGR